MDFKSFKEKYQKAEVRAFPNQVAKDPVVSVIVQTYNHAAYINQCLDSILNQQTDFEFEILLGEDASTDKTREICIKFAEKFPEKIRLFLHHPDNKIRIINLNTGNFNAIYNLYQAKGEYIAFCEGDDYWTDQHKLQKQVDFLKGNSDVTLSYHKFEEKYETQSGSENPTILEQLARDLSQRELSELSFHPLLSTVCFRNHFKDIPDQMIQVLNIDSFVLSILGTFGKGKFQSEIRASVYRRHSGGIWTKKNREIQLLTKTLLFKNLISYYKDKDSLKISFQKDLKNTQKMLLVLYLKDFKPLKAVKLIPGLL